MYYCQTINISAELKQIVFIQIRWAVLFDLFIKLKSAKDAELLGPASLLCEAQQKSITNSITQYHVCLIYDKT